MRLRGTVSSSLFGYMLTKAQVQGLQPGNSRLGLLNRLVRNDQILKRITSVLGSLDELRGQKKVGNLGALAHDGQPLGKLGVVLGDGKRQVVAIIANLLHLVLVNKSPNKVVIGALVLGLELASAGDRGHNLGLSSIKGIDGSVTDILGSGEAVPEESKSGLEDGGERVEALDKSKLDIDEGDVGTAGGVGSKLEETLLANFSHLGLRGWNPVKAHGGELGGKGSVVGLDPLPGLGAVAASAEEVEEEEEANDGENDALALELREGMALVEAVPFCVGAQCLRGLGSGQGVGDGSKGNWRWLGALLEVCKVFGRPLAAV